MKSYLLPLAIAATLYSVAIAQPPKAVITGPKEAAVGDLVILDASQSTGLSYAWALLGSDKTYLPVDGGVRVVFASGSPGEYVFALVAAGQNNNGGAAADVATWTVVVSSPSPPPTPPSPTPPAPAPGPAANPHRQPSPALAAETTAIRQIRMDRIDATKLADLYQQAAGLILLAGDPAAENALRTTASLRDHLATEGKQLNLAGRYAGLAEAVDGYLITNLAAGDRETTEADAAVMSALAWATWECGR